MNILHHLAMTAAEFTGAQTLPRHIAWMSCHFASGNQGLSNLPPKLPAESLIALDDSIPPNGHDPEMILEQLTACAHSQEPGGILLDFQRPGIPELKEIAAILVSRLPCPVCVSSLYAKDLDCPVFLSPPPPHCVLADWMRPWENREIWLEIALEAETIIVTETGSQVSQLVPHPLPELPFIDEELCCRYQVEVLEDRAIFTLARDPEMTRRLTDAAQKQNIDRFISLYQQMNTGSQF